GRNGCLRKTSRISSGRMRGPFRKESTWTVCHCRQQLDFADFIQIHVLGAFYVRVRHIRLRDANANERIKHNGHVRISHVERPAVFEMDAEWFQRAPADQLEKLFAKRRSLFFSHHLGVCAHAITMRREGYITLEYKTMVWKKQRGASESP